ncbi:MAG: 4-hydroxythreonine-4-phosphate dehydrogenase PdxA [Phycisphaerales bacterium]|nr:4-hydroxythreonine-4-phosphate dehydrogenase PdxA [Phycisphaerales bacterium]
MTTRPTISISMGDPGGIGPEVLVRALDNAQRRTDARFIIHGSAAAMHNAALACKITPYWWQVDPRSSLAATATHDVVLMDTDPEMQEGGTEPRFPKAADRLSGTMSFRWVESAIADAQRKDSDSLHAHAVVTGPINKQAWAMAGKRRYPGHTELFAERFRSKHYAMMFVGDKLRVILATVHIPVSEIRNALTIGKVHTAIDLGHQACQDLGIARPRIAVCGLNPHAGEGGLIGDEEARLIEPAIEHASNSGIQVSGPYPADTIYNRAIEGKFDLVVAMYHDQGLIPVKLLERDLAVNVTVGLSTVRTSPDHGTAFDIAGRGIADPGSMSNAIDLAIKMVQSRQSTHA